LGLRDGRSFSACRGQAKNSWNKPIARCFHCILHFLAQISANSDRTTGVGGGASAGTGDRPDRPSQDRVVRYEHIKTRRQREQDKIPKIEGLPNNGPAVPNDPLYCNARFHGGVSLAASAISLAELLRAKSGGDHSAREQTGSLVHCSWEITGQRIRRALGTTAVPEY
jgi:hypothetical protein